MSERSGFKGYFVFFSHLQISAQGSVFVGLLKDWRLNARQSSVAALSPCCRNVF